MGVAGGRWISEKRLAAAAAAASVALACSARLVAHSLTSLIRLSRVLRLHRRLDRTRGCPHHALLPTWVVQVRHPLHLRWLPAEQVPFLASRRHLFLLLCPRLRRPDERRAPTCWPPRWRLTQPPVTGSPLLSSGWCPSSSIVTAPAAITSTRPRTTAHHANGHAIRTYDTPDQLGVLATDAIRYWPGHLPSFLVELYDALLPYELTRPADEEIGLPLDEQQQPHGGRRLPVDQPPCRGGEERTRCRCRPCCVASQHQLEAMAALLRR